jgi:hypothetical protein
MTRHELAAASDELAGAADLETGTDRADRLEDLADQLERLSTADSGPDHGRLARIQSAMHDLREEVDGETVARIRNAHEAIDEYREGLEGV